MTDTVGKLAAVDHNAAVPELDNRDEIGDMARAVKVLKQQAITAKRLAGEQETEQAAQELRQATKQRRSSNLLSSQMVRDGRNLIIRRWKRSVGWRWNECRKARSPVR
jgi:hypothetical protein